MNLLGMIEHWTPTWSCHRALCCYRIYSLFWKTQNDYIRSFIARHDYSKKIFHCVNVYIAFECRRKFCVLFVVSYELCYLKQRENMGDTHVVIGFLYFSGKKFSAVTLIVFLFNILISRPIVKVLICCIAFQLDMVLKIKENIMLKIAIDCQYASNDF